VVIDIPDYNSDERTELDMNRSTGEKGGILRSSLFSKASGSIPPELSPLVVPQRAISKYVLSTKTSVNAANQDYDKLTNPIVAPPSAPVHAACLNGLLKTLANAEGAVAESIRARKLIEGLEKLLSTNRAALTDEEAKF
jgi:regulator of Ty1 transposition protein 103